MDRSQLLDRNGVRAWIAFLIIWAVATAYLAATGGDWVFPIAALLIFGVALSSVIWFLTRKMEAPAVPVERPRRESLALLAYIALYAVLLIGLWLGAVREAIPPGRTQELAVLGYKLAIHVALPVGLILLVGGRVGPLFDSGLTRRGFWPTLIVLSGLLFALLAVVSPSLTQIGALRLAPAAALAWVLASWAWMSLEAGLCEEFLFRACLQSRLTACSSRRPQRSSQLRCCSASPIGRGFISAVARVSTGGRPIRCRLPAFTSPRWRHCHSRLECCGRARAACCWWPSSTAQSMHYPQPPNS